jgi:hypothetical protein
MLCRKLSQRAPNKGNSVRCVPLLDRIIEQLQLLLIN